MKRAFLTVIVCLAAITFLALFLADREIQAGIRRLSDYRFPPHSALEADPGASFTRRHPAKPAFSQHERAAGNMFRRPSGLKIDWERQPAQPRCVS